MAFKIIIATVSTVCLMFVSRVCLMLDANKIGLVYYNKTPKDSYF